MKNKIKEFFFQNKNTRQTFTKNIFWLSTSQVGSRLIRAIIVIYAARAIGASEYGVFSYILGFATFFLPFMDIGINSILTREVANLPEKRSEYFGTAFWMKICLLSISALLLIFFAPHITRIERIASLLPWVALLIMFDGLRDFGTAYLRGIERMEKEAIIVIAMNIFITVFGFATLYASKTAEAFLFSYILGVAASAIITFAMIKERFKHIRIFKRSIAKEILKNGWPIAISGMLGVSMLNIDIIMLGWWRNASEIGFYSAGQRIAQILYTIPALISVAVFPTLSRLAKESQSEKRKMLIEKILTILFMASVPLTIGGVILASPITQFLFGKEYLSTVPIFQILAFTFILVFPGIFFSYAVIAYGKQKETLFYMGAGAMGNIALNALFIPKYGAIGSSIATVVAQLLSYGLIWWYLKRIDNFTTLIYLRKIIAAGIIMGISSFILNMLGTHVLTNIALSAFIYIAMLYLLKEETIAEIKLLIKSG